MFEDTLANLARPAEQRDDLLPTYPRAEVNRALRRTFYRLLLACKDNHTDSNNPTPPSPRLSGTGNESGPRDLQLNYWPA